MKKIQLSAFLLLLAFQYLNAQDTIPNIKGKVILSITKGTFECDFTLSNIPKISDYYIRLNAGMNIRYIKNLHGTGPLPVEKSLQDTLSTGESNAYYIPAYNEVGKYLPKAIQFSYVGKYPVFADTGSVGDWKGNIAFNGTAVRTDGSQTAWYPILYDIKKDLRYDKLTYDIDITCTDCKIIYLNGSQPVEGTHANFKSNVPQELTMFCGNFKMVATNGNYFLNPDMDENQIKRFASTLQSYKSYYEKYLQIPYKGMATYIQTSPVSKHNSWLFATYPTIVNISFDEYGLKTFLDKKRGDGFKPYLAHELGHYYFGTYRTFNSELGDMISEGFAEFLSLSITRKLIGDSIYKTKLESKNSELQNFKPIPMAAVKSKNDYNNRELYVYYYAPLIFTAIEKEIGEAAMWKWLKSILQTPATFTNYQFLVQTLAGVINDKAKLESIQSKYLNTDNAIKNVATTLGLGGPIQEAGNQNQQVVKTYYYFLFSKPVVDAGSPENQFVLHTEIRDTTCTEDALSKVSEPISKRMKAACQNESGCTSDFNYYESPEEAKEALQRWLKPFVNKPGFVVKIYAD